MEYWNAGIVGFKIGENLFLIKVKICPDPDPTNYPIFQSSIIPN
jgi:hypothetical protein